jgi:hypothetical protein
LRHGRRFGHIGSSGIPKCKGREDNLAPFD